MSVRAKLACLLVVASMCFGVVPSLAFAETGLKAYDQAATEAPSSSVDANASFVEASIIDPTEDGVAYDLYMQWSDDSPEGLGKYHWDKVSLAVYVDEANVRYYFVTNPNPERAASELMCTLVWLPKSAAGGTLNIPGHVQLTEEVEGVKNDVGGVRDVVSVGYAGGSKFGDAQDEKNLLPYWYAKDSGDPQLARSISGANNTIYKDGSASAKASIVRFPATVKIVGDTSFYECSQLTSVEFEKGSALEEIGWRAFLGTSISSINLPDTVTALGGPKYYRVGENQYGGIVDYENEDLGKYATDSTCSTPVSTIDERVATGSNEGQVFSNCTSLANVRLPKSLTTIGGNAFQGCTQLKAVYGFDECKLSYFGTSMFYGASSLEDVSLPANLTEIPKMTFMNAGLHSFVIPASVTTIATNAFTGCANLTSVAVDAENEAFASDHGILYKGDYSSIVLIPGGLTDVIVHEGYAGTINNRSFTKNVVKRVVLPDSMKSLAANNFANLSVLEEVVVGAGIQAIPDGCFANCRNLKSVTLKCAGDVAIGSNRVFSNNTSLKRIVFQGAVSSIVVDELSSANWPVFMGCGEKQMDLVFEGDTSRVVITDKELTGSIQPSVTTYFNGSVIRNVYVRDAASVSDDLKNWCACGADFKRADDADSDFSKNLIGIASAAEMSSVCSAALSSDAGIVYDATAKTPAVTVTPLDESVTLAEGTDYEVSYADNVNAGTAKAIVKGMGAYYACEPLEVEFAIEPADISKAVVSEIADQTLSIGEDGMPVACEPEVSVSITLAEGADPVALTADDFDVSYADNALPGTATVTLTGKGNYAGTATATFQVVASDEDKAAAASAESAIAEKLAGATDEGIAACDEAALSAVAGALEEYNRLTDVQKTQVGGSTASALIAAQQKVADAKEKAAAEALAAAEAERDQKAQEAAEAKAQAEQLAKEADEAKAQAEQLKADVEAAKAQASASASLAKPTLTAKTKSKKKGKLTAAWSKVAGADGYELKVGKKTYTVKGGAKVSKTVKAKKGKKVKVQVRAFKRQGDNTLYSAWSAAKKVKVKR